LIGAAVAQEGKESILNLSKTILALYFWLKLCLPTHDIPDLRALLVQAREGVARTAGREQSAA